MTCPRSHTGEVVEAGLRPCQLTPARTFQTTAGSFFRTSPGEETRPLPPLLLSLALPWEEPWWLRWVELRWLQLCDTLPWGILVNPVAEKPIKRIHFSDRPGFKSRHCQKC